MHYDIPRIGSLIREARIGRKLSQTDLAKAVGISKRTVSAIETERSQPAFDVFYQLVRILDISTEHIFWPEKTACVPEQEQLSRAVRSCSEQEQAIFMDIAWAYIRAVEREKGAKKQTVIKPSAL